jgi:predicted GNAT superfamily acetyltransferase
MIAEDVAAAEEDEAVMAVDVEAAVKVAVVEAEAAKVVVEDAVVAVEQDVEDAVSTHSMRKPFLLFRRHNDDCKKSILEWMNSGDTQRLA